MRTPSKGQGPAQGRAPIPGEGLRRRLFWVVVVLGGALALALRICLFPYESADFRTYLEPWYAQMEQGGGIAALAQPLQGCNYPLAYLSLLAPFAGAGVPALPVVKGWSVGFDGVLAFAAALLLRTALPPGGARRAWCAGVGMAVLFLPQVFLNSGMWGQCDSIYTAFCLLALCALARGRSLPAFLLLGVGFAFKLQAVFFLPVFLLAALTDRRIRPWHFALVPAVVFLSGVPAMCAGASPGLAFYMYGVQLDSTGGALTAGCPNLAAFFPAGPNALLRPALVLLGLAAVGLGCAVVLRAGRRLRVRETLLFAAWCQVACVWTLPAMHERYLFPGALLLVVLAGGTRRRGDALCAAVESGVSTLSYLPVLQDGFAPVPVPVLALVRLGCLAYLTMRLVHTFARRDLRRCG